MRKAPGPRDWQANFGADRNLPKRKLGPVEPREYSTEVMGKIENGGPGKNVFVRSQYVREDTGTHETLKIISASAALDDDEGMDPYNTGRFDKTKAWGSYRTRT